MEFIIRALVIYFFMLVMFSMAGKRSLSEMDTFELVLLLIISEATQDALSGTHSLTSSLILITTLVASEVMMGWIKHKKPKVEHALQGGPLIVLEDGKLIKDRADKVMVDEADILNSARESQGLERLEQIKYAIVEMSGNISVIPKEHEA